jgi:hypothetical protein
MNEQSCLYKVQMYIDIGQVVWKLRIKRFPAAMENHKLRIKWFPAAMENHKLRIKRFPATIENHKLRIKRFPTIMVNNTLWSKQLAYGEQSIMEETAAMVNKKLWRKWQL